MFYTHEQADNEFGYHPATAITGPAHDRARAIVRHAAHEFIELLPEGPLKTTAITNLRAAMWAANASIACAGPADAEWSAKIQMESDLYGGGIEWDFRDPGVWLDYAQTIVANVSAGNWEDQSDEWRAAARRWIDGYGQWASAQRQYVPVNLDDNLSVTVYQDSDAGRELQQRHNFLHSLTDDEIELIQQHRTAPHGRAA